MARGTRGARTAGLARDLLVGGKRAKGNARGRGQDATAEAVAQPPVDWQFEDLAPAGEILLELTAVIVEPPWGKQNSGRDSPCQLLKYPFLFGGVEVGDPDEAARRRR